jgi:hypothetical protein
MPGMDDRYTILAILAFLRSTSPARNKFVSMDRGVPPEGRLHRMVYRTAMRGGVHLVRIGSHMILQA